MKDKYGKVLLSKEDREKLRAIVRKGQNKARVIARAQILLRLDDSQGKGQTYEQIRVALGAAASRVSLVVRRYHAGGIEEALSEAYRPGKEPKLSGEKEAKLLALACSAPPEGHTRWTLQLLADSLIELEVVDTISDSAIGEKLKKMKLSLGG